MRRLKPEVAAFFKPFFQTAMDDRIIFHYGQFVFESWAPGLHSIPSTREIWLAGTAYPGLISDLYIGHSAAELMSFASLQANKLLRFPGQMAFAALGLLPTRPQVNYLKALYPHARWHLLFSPDILGGIADAGVASWYKGYPVSFRMNDSWIGIKFRDKAYYFDSSAFSLHRFEVATGLRSGIRTHKPPHGLPSFISLQDHPLP